MIYNEYFEGLSKNVTSKKKGFLSLEMYLSQRTNMAKEYLSIVTRCSRCDTVTPTELTVLLGLRG